jgi:hypothetical protein
MKGKALYMNLLNVWTLQMLSHPITHSSALYRVRLLILGRVFHYKAFAEAWLLPASPALTRAYENPAVLAVINGDHVAVVQDIDVTVL